MPLVQVEADLFLERKGVEVFHTYPDGLIENVSRYWFTTDPETADHSCAHGERGHFDVRLLAARWSQTPSVGQWEEWWKPRCRTEDEAMAMLLQRAIDEERLPLRREGR